MAHENRPQLDRGAPPMTPAPRVLVFGASGYVGTHLVPRLQAAGVPVRAAARSRRVLEARGWPGVEIAEADRWCRHRC